MERTSLTEVRSFFEKPKPLNDFNAIRLGLASPEKIRSWSHGEVIKPETINYRTFKPERDGLFCAKIFGPVTDWECLCGKYKRMKYRGVVCDKCGVEVTKSKVRRERMGHIELAAPVSHVWFFKGLPSRIGLLLDMTMRELERVLYFEAYVVVEPGRHRARGEADPRRGGVPAGQGGATARPSSRPMGAEAIRELLERLDLDEMAAELRMIMRTETSIMRRQKAAKRLKLVRGPPSIRQPAGVDDPRGHSGAAARAAAPGAARRWPFRHLRPQRPLPAGHQPQQPPQEAARPAGARGHRPQREAHAAGGGGRPVRQRPSRPGDQGLEQPAAEVPVRQPQGQAGPFPPEPARQARRLLRSVGDRGRPGAQAPPVRPAQEDGPRAVQAVRLPRTRASGVWPRTIKMAKELVEEQTPEVWDALEKVIREHPVLLNRAPTLHRLGIQAFEPVLVEGKAIKIHPLVCAAYNADFDGDQMAVHVPLSPKAQLEAHILMMSSRNILSPASGRPLAVPSQDMVIGVYYLTTENYIAKGAGKTFAVGRRGVPRPRRRRGGDPGADPASLLRQADRPGRPGLESGPAPRRHDRGREHAARDHGRPGAVQHAAARRHAVHQRSAQEEGAAEPRRLLVHARRATTPRSTCSTTSRRSASCTRPSPGCRSRADDMVIPETQAGDARRRPTRRSTRSRSSVPRAYHRRRAPQQDHRHLASGHRGRGEGDVQPDVEHRSRTPASSTRSS